MSRLPAVYEPGSTAGNPAVSPVSANLGQLGASTEFRRRQLGQPGAADQADGWRAGSAYRVPRTTRNAYGNMYDTFYDWTRSTTSPDMTLQGLIGEYSRAHNEGLLANQQRYEDILGGYRDRYGQAMNQLQGLGSVEADRINRRYDSLSGATQQSLVDRGLYNTTIAPGMLRGVERDRAEAHSALQEQIRRENLGYHTQLSGDTLGFMERRTDTYPNLDQIAQLAIALGETDSPGVGTGGGGAAIVSNNPLGTGTQNQVAAGRAARGNNPSISSGPQPSTGGGGGGGGRRGGGGGGSSSGGSRSGGSGGSGGGSVIGSGGGGVRVPVSGSGDVGTGMTTVPRYAYDQSPGQDQSQRWSNGPMSDPTYHPNPALNPQSSVQGLSANQYSQLQKMGGGMTFTDNGDGTSTLKDKDGKEMKVPSSLIDGLKKDGWLKGDSQTSSNPLGGLNSESPSSSTPGYGIESAPWFDPNFLEGLDQSGISPGELQSLLGGYA